MLGLSRNKPSDIHRPRRRFCAPSIERADSSLQKCHRSILRAQNWRFWSVLGGSWPRVGGSWAHLGGLLGSLGRILDCLGWSWECWGVLGRVLGCLWANFGRKSGQHGPNLVPKMEPRWPKNRSKNLSFFDASWNQSLGGFW